MRVSYTDNASIGAMVLGLIDLKQEGGFWDFKKEWHCRNADLLHDIICMANNLDDHDGYIIIGVDEENDYRFMDVSADPNRKTTQNIVDFLRDKRFAGHLRPLVYMREIRCRGGALDVIIVRNDRNTPYFLTESFEGVFANNIYTRIVDTNTPKNRSADLNNTEYLWKKRFAMDATVLERVCLYLQTPSDWIKSDESEIQFYKYAPEFTIDHRLRDYERSNYSIYHFAQCDQRPNWYDIEIRYHQTTLASLRGSALDGGRYFTSCPLINGVSLCHEMHGWDVSYYYYVEGSLEYTVHKFFYKADEDTMDEEKTAHDKFMKCLLVFISDYEKECFDRYVKEHYSSFAASYDIDCLPHFPEIDGYNMDAFRKEYSDALILNAMLAGFRNRLV